MINKVKTDLVGSRPCRGCGADSMLENSASQALAQCRYAGASWARLLDVAECTETFGLLPKGQLTEAWNATKKAGSSIKLDPSRSCSALEATWQAVLSRPRQAAMRLADTKARLGFLS